jgi:hypothetical protein
MTLLFTIGDKLTTDGYGTVTIIGIYNSTNNIDYCYEIVDLYGGKFLVYPSELTLIP